MRKVLVLGAGESGVGAAILAKKLGKEVFVSDRGKVDSQYQEKLKAFDIPFEEGKHTTESFFDAEIVIKSPGIPPWVPVVKDLVEKGIPVISEIEYGFRYAKAPIIAITGSNGKTTTASLVHHLLVSEGVNAKLGGNIGESFALQVATQDVPQVYVLEVSSFQLDDCVDFRPDIALLLNITPDHLDRYGGQMERYAASKFRLGMNQLSADTFIYNREDPWSLKGMEHHKPDARLASFGLEKGGNAWVDKEELVLDNGDRYPVDGLQILGPHNHLNALSALLAVRAFGKGGTGLNSFRPIPHRLEPIAEVDGIRFINDSKATNVDAVKYALQAVNRPIVWMAGGVDKGNDYGEIKDLVEKKVKAVVVLGENDEKFRRDFSKDVFSTASMKEGVKKAKELAERGDVVLLSPACASFDLFNNYEDRGDQFRKEVNDLRI